METCRNADEDDEDIEVRGMHLTIRQEQHPGLQYWLVEGLTVKHDAVSVSPSSQVGEGPFKKAPAKEIAARP